VEAYEINELFDLNPSIVGLIVGSQAGFRKLLKQNINQLLAITWNEESHARFREGKPVFRCDFNQEREQAGCVRFFHFHFTFGSLSPSLFLGMAVMAFPSLFKTTFASFPM